MFNLSKFGPEELIKSVLKRCEVVDTSIHLKVPDEDIDGMVGKLNELSSLTGMMASCVADSHRVLKQKQLVVLEKLSKEGHSPSILNKMLDAECGDEEALKIYCDKLKSGLTGTMDSIVTLISLWKTEFTMGNKETRIYKKE